MCNRIINCERQDGSIRPIVGMHPIADWAAFNPWIEYFPVKPGAVGIIVIIHCPAIIARLQVFQDCK